MLQSLILGASGFLGNALANRLVATGQRVRGTGRHQPAEDPGFEFETGDLATLDFSRLLTGTGVVYHLAWSTVPYSANRDPLTDAETNVVGTIRLLEAAKRSGVRVVFVSSGGAIYGPQSTMPIPETAATNPISAYGAGKLAAEKYLNVYEELHGLDHVTLRVANLYGEGQPTGRHQGVVGEFVARAVSAKPIEIWGTGAAIRDYIHVDDVVSALIAAGSRTTQSKVFNVGSGEGHTLLDVVDAIATALGRPVEVDHLEAVAGDVSSNILDIRRAQHQLGWKPAIDFTAGVQRVVEAAQASGSASST